MSAFEEQELKKLAAALSTLTPRPAHLDRDGILYEAGRRSVRPSRVWPAIAAAGGVVICVLTLALLVRREPATIVQWVQVPREAAPPAIPPLAAPAPPEVALELDEATLPPGSYWRLQQSALRVGVEGVPMTDPDAVLALPRPRDPIPSVGSRGLATTLLLTGDQ